MAAIGQERRHGVGNSAGSLDGLAGDVERIVDRREGRQRFFQEAPMCAGDGAGRSSPINSQKSSAKPLKAPELVTIAAPLTGGLRKARQNLGGVDQLLQRSRPAPPPVRRAGRHHRVIARHRAGMRARRSPRPGAAPGMQQHDRLSAPGARAAAISRNRCGWRICSTRSAIALAVGSSATRNSRKSSTPSSASLPVEITMRHRQPLRLECRAQARGHGAALRGDGDGRARSTAPGGVTGSKVNGTPSTKLTRPMQLGPRSAIPPAFAIARACPGRCGRHRRSRRIPRRRSRRRRPCGVTQAATASAMPACGQSEQRDVDALGQLVDRSEAGRPPIGSCAVRLTRWMTPP